MAHELRITARAEKKAELSPSKIENKFTIQGGSKLEVFDENNNPLYQGEFKSFTSNFLKLLYGSMMGAGTAKAKDLTNTDLAMDSFPQNTFNILGGAGVKKFGVVVGTNTAAVSVSDYSITVPSGLTVNDTVVSASSVGADSISVEISRQISNSSGSAVNLKEAGLICGSEDEVNSNVLIARDLLDITLENGKKSVWRYTINFNFTNDKGGFVKTFADKMFGGIFEEVTTIANWSGRVRPRVVVFKNKIWVLGGHGMEGYMHDVWYSSDGINWTRATSSAGWSGRRSGASIVFDDKMWIMGGYNGTSNLNDVWNSSDGATWIQVTSSASWGVAMLDERISEIANKMCLIRTKNETWASSNGITWNLISAISALPWNVGCTTFKNRIYTIGGDNTNKVCASKMFIVDFRPGSSDSAFSATATALGAEIADGSGSGELVYGEMPGAATIEPFTSGNKTKFSIAREFTNNSGADITVREVGLFSGSDMLARLILAQPVTIANGGSEIITVDFETEV